MKLGLRTPNLKSRVKARTTGKLKRKAKRSVNPLYGKKGVGLIKDPKKSIYNRIYRRTTVSADRLVGTSGGCLVGTLRILWLIIYLPLKFLFYYPFVLIRDAIRKNRAKTN